jgi:spore maturation protein CgeB
MKAQSKGIIYPKEVYFYHFISNLNKLSSAFRGDILSQIKGHKLEIIGGDLSYGKIVDPLLKFNVPHITYHSATSNYGDTKTIYNKTRLSLNISSLQFDSALNPRVFDVFASGGFLITDRLPDLAEVFIDSDEISYASVEELQFKLDFFSRKENNKKYLEIKEYMKKQIEMKHTYNNLIENIIKKIQ